MATYGVEVLTGLSETRLTGESKTLRSVYWTKLDNGTSGSVVVSEFSESKGFINTSPFSDGDTYEDTDWTVSWDEANKTLSWDLTSSNNGKSLIVSLMMYG